MAVTPEEVRAVAELARLRLESEEVEGLTAQLNGILQHVDELQAADVSEAGDVGRSDRATAETGTPLRDDEPGPDPLARPPRALAPAWEHGFFTVPRLAALDADALDAAADPGEAE